MGVAKKQKTNLSTLLYAQSRGKNERRKGASTNGGREGQPKDATQDATVPGGVRRRVGLPFMHTHTDMPVRHMALTPASVSVPAGLVSPPAGRLHGPHGGVFLRAGPARQVLDPATQLPARQAPSCLPASLAAHRCTRAFCPRAGPPVRGPARQRPAADRALWLRRDLAPCRARSPRRRARSPRRRCALRLPCAEPYEGLVYWRLTAGSSLLAC